MWLYQDNLLSTVNYSEIITLIKEINSNNRFNLLETFSEVLAEKIISYSPLILKVKVRYRKNLSSNKGEYRVVGVELELERNPNSHDYEPKAEKNQLYFYLLDPILVTGKRI